jgi:hypothetical protein
MIATPLNWGVIPNNSGAYGSERGVQGYGSDLYHLLGIRKGHNVLFAFFTLDDLRSIVQHLNGADFATAVGAGSSVSCFDSVTDLDALGNICTTGNGIQIVVGHFCKNCIFHVFSLLYTVF